MDSRTKQAKEKYEGNLFMSDKGGYVKVLCWNNSLDIDIVFIDTGYRTKVRKGNLQQGTMKDRSLPTLYGIGVVGEIVENPNPQREYAYRIWTKMLERCYCEATQHKNPTYIGCQVSDCFKNFQHFYSWCSNQTGFYVEGFALDKDILVKGNKVYSEDTCCFVPKEINNLLLTSKRNRGNCVLGVYKINKSEKYRAEVRRNGRGCSLGCFNTEIEAFQAYKEAKEAHIKEIANKWKDQIDNRVYKVLISHEVHIDD